MRRSYVYDEETKSMIPKEEWLAKQDSVGKSCMIMPDIPDFQSPVDGSIVHGRRSLREHNKRHNVTNVADYKNTWEAQAKERGRAYTPGSGYDRERRREAIARSIDKLRGR